MNDKEITVSSILSKAREDQCCNRMVRKDYPHLYPSHTLRWVIEQGYDVDMAVHCRYFKSCPFDVQTCEGCEVREEILDRIRGYDEIINECLK